MTATVVEEQPSGVAPPREWWQVWAQRRAQWWAARPVLATRWAKVRAVGLWVGLLWVLGLLVLWPEAGLGLRAYLGALWVAVAWFFLARTKTLTWSGYMRFFTGCVAWSSVIGVVSTLLATVAADTWVSNIGPSVAIASMTEEALKLVPVALVALLAPRRAARFAAVDWLLLGVASGVAFQGVEEMARRWWLYLAETLGSLLARPWGEVAVPSGWYRFGAFPVPSRPPDGVADFAGHMVATATTAGLVGLALVVVRTARSLRARSRWALTVLAVGLPVVALLVSIGDHALSNLEGNGTGQVNEEGVPRWLDPADSTIPAWMRVPWSALGHGHDRVPIFLLLALVLLLVDAHRLARVPASALVPVAAPAWVAAAHRSVTGLLTAWPTRLAHPLALMARAVTDLVWVVGRDLRQCLTGFARVDSEPRRAAVARGQTTVAAARAARELTFSHLNGEPDVRRRRLVALVALLVLLWAALVEAPRLAAEIGSRPYGRVMWLAGQFDSLSSWWSGLSPWQQIAIGVGVAAVVALSGGSLGLALGVSGILTWGLDKSAGIATFIRDPHQAARDYLATATPAQLAADTLGFALTFGPGALGGAVAGRGVRAVAGEFIADPAGALARRRALLQGASDAGEAQVGLLVGRPVVDDGAALLAQHRKAISQVFRDFPRGTDDATKAAWYRQAAQAEELPDYMRPVLNGRAFHHEVYGHFDAVEVTVNQIGPNGRTVQQFRVDGLSAGDVISVKDSQIASITPDTAKAYVREMVAKYNPLDPSLVVAPTAGNQAKLASAAIGRPLDGDMVLAIPVQNASIPPWFLDYAANHGVIVRELAAHAATRGL